MNKDETGQGKHSGDEGVYGRATPSNTDDTVANRAKVLSVIRKAEEFLRTNNPNDAKRALELAAGRVGLTYDEYKRLVAEDPELLDYERRICQGH